MAEQKKQDVNQLLKVRRDKLADLQANGRDPFQITQSSGSFFRLSSRIRFRERISTMK